MSLGVKVRGYFIICPRLAPTGGAPIYQKKEPNTDIKQVSSGAGFLYSDPSSGTFKLCNQPIVP